jgi:hypothetical protein
MNLFKIIGSVLELVPRAVDAIRSLATAARPKPKPANLGRKHFWIGYATGNSTDATAECLYCKHPRTLDNVNEICPGAEVRR